MVLTRQQKFIQESLKRLGGTRKQQMAALMRPVFCTKHPEYAEHIVETTVEQLRHCNMKIHWKEGICFLGGNPPCSEFLEAIDIMLELSNNAPLDYWRGDAPVLLRFQLQEGEKIRMFAVAKYGYLPSQLKFRHTERVIWLFDGQGHPQALPVSNKQFFAVRQENGRHRFFTP